MLRQNGNQKYQARRADPSQHGDSDRQRPSGCPRSDDARKHPHHSSKEPLGQWHQREYVRLDEIPMFTGISMATVNRQAGIEFPVFYLNQKVRVAKRVDIEKWIESGLRLSDDGVASDEIKKRRTRPTKGVSTPELDAMHDEARNAYDSFMDL